MWMWMWEDRAMDRPNLSLKWRDGWVVSMACYETLNLQTFNWNSFDWPLTLDRSIYYFLSNCNWQWELLLLFLPFAKVHESPTVTLGHFRLRFAEGFIGSGRLNEIDFYEDFVQFLGWKANRSILFDVYCQVVVKSDPKNMKALTGLSQNNPREILITTRELAISISFAMANNFDI